MTWLADAGHDIRYAWRALRRMKLLAAVVVVSLGAGIGVNTIVFSWMQARFLKPLPGVRDGGAFEIVDFATDARLSTGASWLDYRDLAGGLRTFRGLIAFRMLPLAVGETGRVERVYGLLVSGNYFAALDLQPVLGRLLQPADAMRPGGEPVAVISHGLWQTRFSGQPTAVGQVLRINGRDVTVVGVAPREFQGTIPALAFEVYLPVTLAPAVLPGSRELDDRGARGYQVLGRLRAGVTREQAQAELSEALRGLARTHPATNRTLTGDVLPFWRSPRGPQRMLTGAIAMLQAIMLLLLLAICANTANLLLARASARSGEIALRRALGAGRWRIASLLLAETLMLALFGALAGAGVAVWGTQVLRVLPLSGFPLRFETHIDAQALAFASLLGLLGGVLAGAAAAMPIARVDGSVGWRAGAYAAPRRRLRDVLLGAQVALAVLVLVAAGLFLRGMLETRRHDPGFRREGVLLAGYDYSGRDVPRASIRRFTADLLARLRASPLVDAAAVSASVPLDIHGLPVRGFTVEGRTRADGGADQAATNTVTPGYFALMGIPFRSGRDFADLTDAALEPQAIVNEAFVERYLAGAEPIGRHIESRGSRYTIVGVVRTSLSNAFGERPTPAIYLSYRDNPLPLGEIHLRTRPGAEASHGPLVRRVVAELDAELAVFNVRTLNDHVETNLVLRRVPAQMFSVLGPLLLVLVAIGIYGVAAYTVSLRTREIGVRTALGATAGRVTRDLMGDGLRIVAAGASLGWLAAFAIASVFVEDRATDWTVFLGVPALVLIVAAVACWLPVRRATRVDPTVALRQD